MTKTHGLQSLKYLHSGPLQTKIIDPCTKCPEPGLAVGAAIVEMFFYMWEEKLLSGGEWGHVKDET